MFGFFRRPKVVGDPRWNKFVRYGASQGIPPDVIAAIEQTIAPFGISPERFIDNYTYLECEGQEWALPEGIPMPTPTRSALRHMRRMDRASGMPVWFLAAFPDVAQWLHEAQAAKFREDGGPGRAILEQIDARVEGWPEGDVIGPDGKITAKFGALLASVYRERTGCVFECAS